MNGEEPMERQIKFNGNPLTLVGRALKENVTAPSFRVVSTDLKEVTLGDFGNKIKVITSFPSSDTPVCDLQVKEFNKRAVNFSHEVTVIGISKDLPFAQKRFCDLNKITNVTTLSDYKYSSFGINYGLLIKELNLLARAVLIVDNNNILRYLKVVEELTTPPDYEDALENLEKILNKPSILLREELPSHCKPCEAGTLPLPEEKIKKLLEQINSWQLVEDKKLVKEFKFKDFLEAKYFLDLVSIIAEEQGHHPTFTLIYNKLRITLTTHAVGGLSDNDFIMAGIINELI
ncbi:MAG: thiol peroxidase [Candidatus Omnitrophica bacterium]|nr:thiol peroxidase [Candidatus Omnitrophota bacterium]